MPIIVVGSGIAGLWTALNVSGPVLLLTEAHLGQSASTLWAQGGVAGALDKADSAALHAADTIAAGAGLVDEAVAIELARCAPEQIERLERLGVPFERHADGQWALSREAAHRFPRVARVGGDRAGAAIVDVLARAVRQASHIRVRDCTRVVGLVPDTQGGCAGVLVERSAGTPEFLPARATVLATGGIGGLYALTTNPAGSQGQGLAWASMVGAEIRQVEFVQFHPTAIDVGRSPAPLATEALRGEGARLVDGAGRRFVYSVHPDGELAPRDVVARAVHRQVQSGCGAFLDATRAVGEAFPRRFEAVFEACMRAGIDPRRSPIPVAPAAHYHMGGIATGLDGRTTVERLFAVGEVANTGAHGANRLASNSLAEALVMGAKAGAALAEIPSWQPEALKPSVEAPLPSEALDRLRQLMSAHAGVERDAVGLHRLIAAIDAIEFEHGRADALVSARMIAAAAAARQESRGAHFRSDDRESTVESIASWMSSQPDAGDRGAKTSQGVLTS